MGSPPTQLSAYLDGLWTVFYLKKERFNLTGYYFPSRNDGGDIQTSWNNQNV
jgi:hypothetical protein